MRPIYATIAAGLALLLLASASMAEVVHDGMEHEVVPNVEHCKCSSDVQCFTGYGTCTNNFQPTTFPPGGRAPCISGGNNFPFYSCAAAKGVCYNTNTCDPVHERMCRCRRRVICYTNESDCHKNQDGIPTNPGDRTQCVALGRSVYRCEEEPGVCRSVSTCRRIHGGHGEQDPHFRGFDDSQYYFGGIPGREYNIISDVGLQVNAQFIRLDALAGTYMGRIGIRFGEQSLAFDPHFGIFLNGTQYTSGTLELPTADLLIELIDERFRFTLRTDVWQIIGRVNVEQGLVAEAYVNLQVSLHGRPTDPHGILGQTARFMLQEGGSVSQPGAKFQIEGEESDYEVRDGLLGTDFTFNRFRGEVPARLDENVGEARHMRFQRSLFEASVDV